VPGGGGSIGQGLAEASEHDIRSAFAGGIRLTIEELRERARLERANRPSPTRYLVWGLAVAAAQPISEIERMRMRDVPYFMEFLKSKKVPDGDR